MARKTLRYPPGTRGRCWVNHSWLEVTVVQNMGAWSGGELCRLAEPSDVCSTCGRAELGQVFSVCLRDDNFEAIGG